MRRGLFVTFEGSEGCGKSTQIRHLSAWLQETAQPCLTTREPGGTAAGDRIRDLLQHARRAQHVREVIRPALARGEVVISDRFHDSTTVYQGVARQLEPQMTRTVNGFAIGDTLPDITFLFDMDAAEAHRRIAQRDQAADRMEREPLAFYQAVRQGYLRTAADQPARFVVLDATRPEEQLAAQIRGVLTEKFHGFFAR
jgi:dTMP kinase